MIDQEVVVIKLVSGENVMATLTNEDENYVELNHPMVIKTIPFIDRGRAQEHVTASPLCQFSDDTNYTIPKSSIMFVKKLHDVMIPHYTRLVSEQENTILVRSNKSGRVEILDDEEEPPLSLEEIRRRIEMLQAIADAPVTNTKEEEEEVRYFIEGNETKH